MAEFMVNKLPNGLRNHLLAALAEFFGTTSFLFLAFAGTQIANTQPDVSSPRNFSTGPDLLKLLYISFSFASALMVNVWIFYRVSGGQFNPAVTIGLCLVGAVPVVRAVLIIFAQFFGGIIAAALVSGMFPDPLAVTTSLGGGTSMARGFWIETFLTSVLVLTVIMLAVVKHKATYLAPVGIGSALFIIHMAGVYYSGGSVNPARSFGPAVVNRSFPREHWIYWFGPTLGAILAAGFYKILKAVSYETINPGQDFDDLEAGSLDGITKSTRPVIAPTHAAPVPDREVPQASAQAYPAERVRSVTQEDHDISKKT